MRATDPDYPAPSSEAVSNAMKGNRKADSRPERLLRHVLHARGLRYRKNPAVRTKIGLVRPDLTFPASRVAVFVDGCYWHSCPLHATTPRANRCYWEPKLRRNRERDELVSRILAEEGWLVVRVWEHDVPDVAADIVESTIRTSRRGHASRDVDALRHHVAPE